MLLPYSSQIELNGVIGRNVEELRKQTPLTKTDFLHVIGLGAEHKYPETYYNKLARGEVGYSLFTLLLIKRTFDVTLDELIS